MRAMIVLAAVAAAPALADTSFTISVSNRVTEVQPSATVEVWAEFDEGLYSFAGSMFDVAAAQDAGLFSDPVLPFKDWLGILDPGDIAPDGDSVTGILSGQICSPIDCPLGLDRSNPILVWSVTWSTTDFSARVVPLTTFTKKFDVYVDQSGTSKSALDELAEGFGTIEVGCYADCTGDGSLDLFDFLCFVNQFNAGDHSADCDGSGGLDLFDFLCFVNAFNAGC